jgi:hypothetical protein
MRGNVHRTTPVGTLGELGWTYPEPNPNLSIGFEGRSIDGFVFDLPYTFFP